jgi:peptide deformylase
MNNLNLDNRSKLHLKAAEVPMNEDVSELIHVMWDVLKNSEIPAVGLAAPQIGASQRVIIINMPGVKLILINPKITRRRLGTVRNKEGCLSYPGLFVKMKRDKQIIVEGFDLLWNPVKHKFRGLESYVVQHEIDHLNGITINEE